MTRDLESPDWTERHLLAIVSQGPSDPADSRLRAELDAVGLGFIGPEPNAPRVWLGHAADKPIVFTDDLAGLRAYCGRPGLPRTFLSLLPGGVPASFDGARVASEYLVFSLTLGFPRTGVIGLPPEMAAGLWAYAPRIVLLRYDGADRAAGWGSGETVGTVRETRQPPADAYPLLTCSVVRATAEQARLVEAVTARTDCRTWTVLPPLQTEPPTLDDHADQEERQAILAARGFTGDVPAAVALLRATKLPFFTELRRTGSGLDLRLADGEPTRARLRAFALGSALGRALVRSPASALAASILDCFRADLAAAIGAPLDIEPLAVPLARPDFPVLASSPSPRPDEGAWHGLARLAKRLGDRFRRAVLDPTASDGRQPHDHAAAVARFMARFAPCPWATAPDCDIPSEAWTDAILDLFLSPKDDTFVPPDALIRAARGLVPPPSLAAESSVLLVPPAASPHDRGLLALLAPLGTTFYSGGPADLSGHRLDGWSYLENLS